MTSNFPQVVEDVTGLRQQLQQWRAAGEGVALIPTMGALHDGHLRLVQAGQRYCQRTVTSIFVNPTQFGPQEDLARYPQDRQGDLAKLATVGCDLAFCPRPEQMYPPGFTTRVSVTALHAELCGANRPVHFDGVATVVTKLLLQALPDVACFGEKDYQQLQLIRRLVLDLDIPVTIHGEPTVREDDGLALSSRNRYLSAEERAIAPLLHRSLHDLATALATPNQAVAPLLATTRATLAAAGFDPIDYLEVRDALDLQPLTSVDRPARVLIAARLGNTRLIDNVAVLPGA